MENCNRDKQTIEAEVDKTLQCLDGIEKVKPSPFFYTRLQRRFDEIEDQEYQSVMDYLSVKLLRPGFVSLLVAASIFAGILIEHLESSSIRKERLETIVKVYNLSGPDLNEYILTNID